MTRFDDTLDLCVNVVRKSIRGAEHGAITVVRDATGKLTVVVPDRLFDARTTQVVARRLDEALGRYSPGERRVLFEEGDLIAREEILDSPDRVRLSDWPGFWLLDRLVTNQDWLREPVRRESPVPLATAFSVKGGVGRSTAVAVLAWSLARIGRRVAVVDLDLEAPGLASLLLPELPDYGLVDWLVERIPDSSLPARAAQELLEEALAPSPADDEAPGTIEVLPAFGKRTKDYVTKLGRILLPVVDPDGRATGLRERLVELVDALVGRAQPPEVVILDARAGVHDLGAAAVTQLGAEVFVFGRDEPQAWQALRLLLDHLRLARGIEWGAPARDLRHRLHMTAAQIGTAENDLRRWAEASYDAWEPLFDSEPDTEIQVLAGRRLTTAGRGKRSKKAQAVRLLRKAAAVLEGSPEPFVFGPADIESPHWPVPVYFDQRVTGLRLIGRRDRPASEVLDGAFGPFVRAAMKALLPAPKRQTRRR